MISLVEWGAWADPEAYLDFYAFFMTSMVEWGAWAGPASLKMISSVEWGAWEAQNH